MPHLKGVSSTHGASDYLRLAREAETAEQRGHFAQRGLEAAATSGDEEEAELELLLLRQLYLSQLESHRLRDAADTAARMVELGRMPDLAHHDMSRAWAALGDAPRAIAAQRLAARSAPPDRRSFQFWALANLLHQQGDTDGALGALAKAERWSREDRPLLVGHRAWIELEAGHAVADIGEVVSRLESSRAGKGIGRLILGMLCYEMGDARAAAVHLRAFLRRNAAIDAAKALSLREELRIARTVLAKLESD